MFIAESFLYYADDCTDYFIPNKFIEQVDSIIETHHPDWTADTAKSIGHQHYMLSIQNDNPDFIEVVNEASKALNLHPALNRVLLEYLKHRYTLVN